MKLYEITGILSDILEDAYHEILMNGEVSEETRQKLDSANTEFTEKSDLLACEIKNKIGLLNALKDEEKSLNSRAKTLQKNIDFLKNYLLCEMQKSGNRKIETARNRISVRKNPASIKVYDEFIDWAKENHNDLLNYAKPTPSLAKIKHLLECGEVVPHTEIIQTERIDVK